MLIFKSDSQKPQFWTTYTKSLLCKQHACLHCCGIKQLLMLFSPRYPTEGYRLSTEANKSPLVTWQSKLTYLCCKCRLLLCSEAKLRVKENLVLQQTIKFSNPVSENKSLFWGQLGRVKEKQSKMKWIWDLKHIINLTLGKIFSKLGSSS